MSTTSFSSAKRNNFTMVDNNFINNPKLTLEAKHLLTIFLSNSEDWKINMSDIVKRSKNGRDKHYACLRELITHGYVARIEIHNGTNKRYEQQIYVFSDIVDEVKAQTDTIYRDYLQQGKKVTIYHEQNKQKSDTEKPFTENPDTGQKPFTENPDTEKPDTENPHINNKNLENKNYKKKNLNKDQSREDVINSLNVPDEIKTTLIKFQKRLIDDDISLNDIENNYKAHTEILTAGEYQSALNFVLTKFEAPIVSIEAAMRTAITKKIDFREKANQSNQPKQDNMPKWYTEDQENSEKNAKNSSTVNKNENTDFEDEKARFQRMLEERKIRSDSSIG